MSDIAALAPEHIRVLKAYQPGKPLEELERELGITGAIKIASNENPMGPSPVAVEAAQAALHQAHLYPDGGCFKLRAAVADKLGVPGDELVFGAGSNELIYLLVSAFCRPGVDQVLAHKYAFISYKLAAMSQNVPFVEAEVTEDLGCDVDAMIAALTERTRIVFLANPNNPTGAHVTTADFERLLAALPEHTVLVVDEAYHEYAVAAGADYPRSQSYRDRCPRIVTLRTFSKIYGLSGMRVGYGIADPAVCNLINRVRRPFNVNSIAQVAGAAALNDDAHVQRSSEAARVGIEALSEAVRKIGLRPYPSLGNFVLVGLGREAAPVYDQLLHKGVIVRPMGAWGLPQHIRVSVGTPEQTERVVAALGEL
jgi:histidinol-phosphate aminotransferase